MRVSSIPTTNWPPILYSSGASNMTKIDLLKRSAALAATFAFAFSAVGSPAFAKQATKHIDAGIEAEDSDAD